MDFLELAKNRHSVRSYSDKKVEQEKLDKILQASRVAPTANNSQAHRLLVIQEKEGLDKLKKGPNVYGAPLAIIVCSDYSANWRRPIDDKILADIDASIVTDHMMLQATELGLGTIWVCWINPRVLKKEFNIPDNIAPINVLEIGYSTIPSDTPAALTERHETRRKPIEHSVFYESF